MAQEKTRYVVHLKSGQSLRIASDEDLVALFASGEGIERDDFWIAPQSVACVAVARGAQPRKPDYEL